MKAIFLPRSVSGDNLEQTTCVGENIASGDVWAHISAFATSYFFAMRA
jgi:hypothetical protein